MKKSMIWVTFQKEGIHCYPEAATDPTLKTGDWDDVSFLGSPHRHIFGFKVWIEVFTDNRNIEFIQFKRWLERLYSESVISLDHKSCEMMSDDLYSKISEKYPNREVWIEVSEDGENGSYTEYKLDTSSDSSDNTEKEEPVVPVVKQNLQSDNTNTNKETKDLSDINFDVNILPDLKDDIEAVKNTDDPSILQNIVNKMISKIKSTKENK